MSDQTLALPASAVIAVPTARLLGRSSAGTGATETLSLSEALDLIGSASQGDIIYRGASAWARLAAGSVGQVLSSGGAGANPAWSSAAAGGLTGQQQLQGAW